jgi:hypothetical protein
MQEKGKDSDERKMGREEKRMLTEKDREENQKKIN